MKVHKKKLPEVLVERMARLYNLLKGIKVDDRRCMIASHTLGKMIGSNSIQVRKDISMFISNNIGIKGRGYLLKELRSKLRSRLKLRTSDWPVILAGAGALGKVMLNYPLFKEEGYNIVAVVDNAKEKIGKKIKSENWGELVVDDIENIEKIVEETGARLAIVTVPMESTQYIVDILTEAGIEGILNYSAPYVKVPPHVKVRHVSSIVEMEVLAFSVGKSQVKK